MKKKHAGVQKEWLFLGCRHWGAKGFSEEWRKESKKGFSVVLLFLANQARRGEEGSLVVVVPRQKEVAQCVEPSN